MNRRQGCRTRVDPASVPSRQPDIPAPLGCSPYRADRDRAEETQILGRGRRDRAYRRLLAQQVRTLLFRWMRHVQRVTNLATAANYEVAMPQFKMHDDSGTTKDDAPASTRPAGILVIVKPQRPHPSRQLVGRPRIALQVGYQAPLSGRSRRLVPQRCDGRSHRGSKVGQPGWERSATFQR